MSKFTLCAFADEASSELNGQIEALRENGITHLEIRGVDCKNVSEISVAEAREIRRKLDDAGIKVHAIGSPTGKMDIEGDFPANMESFKHMLELADILGAPYYRLFSFYGVDSNIKRDIALEYLERMLECSGNSGITLCHENEKGIYGEKAAECLFIHQSLPKLKAVFDPANFIQVGQNTLEAWDLLSAHVEYMHIKDATADGKIVPAGKGEGRITELAARYGEMGGRVLTLEPHLAVFEGLAELEREQESKSDYMYHSNREAFDAAVEALKEII